MSREMKTNKVRPLRELLSVKNKSEFNQQEYSWMYDWIRKEGRYCFKIT